MEEKNYHMSIDLTLSIINGKWKSLILCHLGSSAMRNGELLREIPDITQKVLTQQLKELINDNVVKRTSYPGLPLHVDYSLTDEGKTLRKVLIDMSIWGEQHALEMEKDGQKVNFLADNYNGFTKIGEQKEKTLTN